MGIIVDLKVGFEVFFGVGLTDGFDEVDAVENEVGTEVGL